LALADRIDLAVGADQRGYQQGAAIQAGRIAKRAHRDVNAGSLPAVGGQGGGHDHGGNVFGFQIEGAGRGCGTAVDAQTFQHADQRLASEFRIVQGVAGAVQSNHQAIAHQHIVADTLEIGDVLDPRTCVGRNAGEQHRRRGKGGDQILED
jgi:hypothetical protein